MDTIDLFYLLFFLKYQKYYFIKKKLEEKLNRRKTFRFYINLLELIASFLIFSHISSCLWVYIARYEREN